MTQDAMRVAFEEWYADKFWKDQQGKPYFYPEKEDAWIIWQAAHQYRDAEVQKLREALGDCLIMIERLKKHSGTQNNAGYTADGRMLQLSEVESRSRQALTPAKESV